MSAEAIDTIRAREKLLALRSELADLASTGAEAAATVELDQQRVGRVSRMEALQAQAVAGATLARRRALAVRVERALARLDDDEYGDCLDCGETILPARLEVDPAAEYCLACADAHA